MVIREDECALRQPDATCEGCGARGTVGRVSRWRAPGATSEGSVVVEEHRYCARCWPEWSAFYRARWDEEDRLAHEGWMRRRLLDPDDETPPPPGSGMSCGALTWHLALQMVRDVVRALHRPRAEVSEEALAQYAARLAAQAAELEGPMPLEVEDFIQKYAGRTG
jgi:hypothetical protein